MIKFLLTILKIFLIIVAVLVLFNTVADAQLYYSPISENQYNKIAMGDLFYEGQIQLTDGTWHKGWIARFPDSNRLRFRAKDDSIHIFMLTNKIVKSFCYNLKDSTPKFIFKDIPITKRRSETKAIEYLIAGDINLYIHKTVQKITYTNGLLQKKYEYHMLVDFYLEKDGELHHIKDFERDLSYLIRDKKDFFDYYRKTKKERRDRIYSDYINMVIKYNETEVDKKDQEI
jgi:hypothetical protein